MTIKLTGVRSLQNKLDRMAFDLKYDAARILRECPERAEVADNLHVVARHLGQAARSC